MIIDQSYFIGGLHVAGLDIPTVQEKLNRYIVRYETEYLERILGYELATNFLAGLIESPVDDIWVALLTGATFYNTYGILDKWKGFIQSSENINYTFNTSVKGFAWIVGQAGSPIAGTSAFSDNRLLNKQFIIERIGYGTLFKEGDEGVVSPDFSMTGSTITLLNGDAFAPGEKYYIHLLSIGSTINYTGINISPIANYVYFYYMRDNATQTTRNSEKLSKSANATDVSPENKQRAAWNEMVWMNKKLYGYLRANNVTYGYNLNYNSCNELFKNIMFYD
jgi:hypothetical protein